MKKITFLNYLSAIFLLLITYSASAQYQFPACAAPFDPAKDHYIAGEQVSLDGINYEASYWVSTPPPSTGWVALGPCGDGGLGPNYSGQQRIVGYLPYWVPDFDLVNDFDPSAVTHLNIAFNLFKQNNNDFNSSNFASIEWGEFHNRKVDSLLFDLDILNRAHQAGVTVSVAIGGATDFAFIWLMEKYYNNDTKLEEIANFIVNYVNTKGIDGVDLDLECWWPDPSISGTVEKGGRVRGDKWGGADQGPEPAAIGLTKLAEKLRQKMPNKILSAAVFGTSWYGNNYDDGLAEHLDWLGLMTYDFTGSWDASPKGPHSALYKVPLGTYTGQSADNPIYSAEDALEYWMGIAEPAWNHDGGFDVPKAKLCIGVPLYGYDFAQTKPVGNGYVAVSYRNIIASHPDAATSYDPQDPHNIGGKVDQIYYNTPAAGAAKITYTANYGHQGVIIWELTQDVPFSSTSSIMKAINDAAGNTVGTPPSATITSPANGSSFNQGDNITISATATDTDGNVTKVDFYAGSSLIGTDNSSPYSVTWNNAPSGNYNLKAIATDNDNKTGSSVTVAISVIGEAVLTSIVVSPATATINEGTTQQFTAQGYDQYNNPITTSVTWSASGNTISTSGLFTGSTSGNFTVTATSGSVSGTASITIEPAGGSCTSPQYQENGGYSDGSLVQNNGTEYECKPWPYSGWCNGAAWAYEPGVGLYWADAWIEKGPCPAAAQNPVNNSIAFLASEDEIVTYPNPFSKIATFNFNLQEDSFVEIKIYNSAGVEIRSLINTNLRKGQHEIQLDGSTLPSGLYIYKINYNNHEKAGSLIKE